MPFDSSSTRYARSGSLRTLDAFQVTRVKPDGLPRVSPEGSVKAIGTHTEDTVTQKLPIALPETSGPSALGERLDGAFLLMDSRPSRRCFREIGDALRRVDRGHMTVRTACDEAALEGPWRRRQPRASQLRIRPRVIEVEGSPRRRSLRSRTKQGNCRGRGVPPLSGRSKSYHR